MKARPAIFSNILIMGGGSPGTDGPPMARVGGVWAEPNLGLSYLFAARHVLEGAERERRLNEVALPAAYLQRHALEVALKDTIGTAFAIKRDEGWLEGLKRDPKARPASPREIPFTHDLKRLLGILREALAAIGFGDVPAQIVALAERLGAVEQFEPTRFRYLTLKGGARSFPEPVLLLVGETQDLLEALFEGVFTYQGTEPDENLVTSLAHEGMALDQAILRIVPLDEL